MSKPSKYITRAGFDVLERELYQLWKVERPAITKSVQEAAAQGDRSENAEYIYGKKRMREIDRRVRYLSRRLENITVVDRPPDDCSRIYFGARVALVDENNTAYCWRILGPDELDPTSGHISIDSPVARALIGHHVEDIVQVSLPDTTKRYTITAIQYEA